MNLLPDRVGPIPVRSAAARVGSLLLAGVDRGVEERWNLARSRAAATSGATAKERVRQVTAVFSRELTTAGAAAGAAAAVPGAGTGTAVFAGGGELVWFTVRITDLILTIAAIHGHGRASVEERRAWVLAVLAFGDSAASGFRRIAGEVGRDMGARASEQLPAATLRAVNRILGRRIATRYGARRGGVALGRLLPFGIGAAVGGAANYATVRTIARQADRFFRQLPFDPEGEHRPA